MKMFKIVLFALATSAIVPAVGINFRPLPFLNLNEGAGLDRSNVSFAESDLAFMNGDDFTLIDGFFYRINAVTVYSVASTLGDPLGNEFSSVALWGRKPGEALQQLAAGTPGTTFNGQFVGNSNPNIEHTLIQYLTDDDFEAVGSPGNFYPVWATTFSNLNWIVAGGTLYEYAVQGVGVAPDAQNFYGYWFSHASNAFVGGNIQLSADGRFRIFDATNPNAASAVVNPITAGLWDKTADMNILMDIDVVGGIPEPSTWAMMSIGLAGAFLASRRRSKQ